MYMLIIRYKQEHWANKSREKDGLYTSTLSQVTYHRCTPASLCTTKPRHINGRARITVSVRSGSLNIYQIITSVDNQEIISPMNEITLQVRFQTRLNTVLWNNDLCTVKMRCWKQKQHTLYFLLPHHRQPRCRSV